ncbi:MAG TPA: Ig-like domain-containing protein, partial [Planctomycetaceae bacterium]
MGRTDWLAPLRNGFPTTSRTRSRRRGPGSVEALERRIPLSDPLGLLTGAALLGGGLAAAEAEAAPPADDAVPAPEEDRRAAGASLPADDESAFPPPEILEANTVAAAPPPPSSPAAPPAASALTADLLDDLLAPPPAASSPAPAADLARDPLVDTSPKTGGGGAGGHDAAGGSGGGGQDGARSRGGLIADEPADGTTGDGTADLSGDAVAFSTTSGGGYGSGSGGGSGSGSGGGEPPVAVDDAFEVNYTRRTTTTANVVGNDRNYNQYGAQVVLVTPPQDHDGSQGAFVLDATGSFNYLAPHDWDLSDTFTYKITSPNGDSTEATVTLGFQDSPPTGAEDNYACLADAPLVVSADKGVLANDSD